MIEPRDDADKKEAALMAAHAEELTENAEALKEQRDEGTSLAGFCCPHCGNGDEFDIVITTVCQARGDDFSVDGDREWDDESRATCHKCDHDATVGYFTDPRNIAVLAVRLALAGGRQIAREIAEIAIEEIEGWKK